MTTVITILLCSIVILFYKPVNARQCYICSCNYDWDTEEGSCSETNFNTSCLIRNVTGSYCTVDSYYVGNYERRDFSAIQLTTKYQDSHFFEAVETIALGDSKWSATVITSLTYSCDWDLCNTYSISEYLPYTFQITIDESVLNYNLIDSQQFAEKCNECFGCIKDISVTLCSIKTCTHGLCSIDEIHNYAPTASNNCTYSFYSVCIPSVDNNTRPYVRIHAVYYIDLPGDKQVEISEVDLRCSKDFCNTIEVVEILKNNVQMNINITQDFQPSRPNVTTTVSDPKTSTVSDPKTSTVSDPKTTTPDSAATISSGVMIIVYFMLALLIA